MVLEQFLTISVKDLRQAGLLKPNTRQKALFEWRRDVLDYASITAVTNGTEYGQYVLLSYYHHGEPVEQLVTLYLRDLYNGGAVLYFACPVSGLACRKLYFDESRGQFVGRVVVGAPYLHTLRAAERRRIEAAPYRWRLLNTGQRAVTL